MASGLFHFTRYLDSQVKASTNSYNLETKQHHLDNWSSFGARWSLSAWRADVADRNQTTWKMRHDEESPVSDTSSRNDRSYAPGKP